MLGLSTNPSLEIYDLVVIGGGPAGLGAAVYGASEGLKTVLIERTTTGGQAGHSSRIENYLGFPDGVSGRRADRRGPPAGRAVRRRGDHHPRGGQAARRRRRRARTIAVRRRQHRSAPTRSSWPPASTTGSCRSPAAGATPTIRRATTRPRRLLRRLGVRRLGVRRRGRLHRRRRQLGRPGRDVHVQHGEVGDHAGARPVAGGVDVALPDPADRAAPTTSRVRTCTEVVDTLGEDDHLTGLVPAGHGRPARRETVRCGAVVLLHRRRARAPTGSTAVVARDDHGFVLAGPGPAGRRRLDAGPSAAPPGNKRARCVRRR